MVVTDGVSVLSIADAVNEGWMEPLWLGFNNQTQTAFTVGDSVFDPDQDLLRSWRNVSDNHLQG